MASPSDPGSASSASRRSDTVTFATSRASLICDAVAISLEARKRGNEDKAFGLWQPKGADGVAYQRKFRAEW